jgi:LacI family transcriptional regulator
LIAGPLDEFIHGKMKAGYAAALKEAGLIADDRLLAHTRDPVKRYFATKAMLEQPDPPTAFFLTHDSMAQSVCQAITDSGRRIGSDVSVIGYDDLPWSQQPAFLTTFREPCFDLGAEAALMLIERIADGWAPPTQLTLNAPLVVRRSAGPIPSAGDYTGREIILDWRDQAASTVRTKPADYLQ